LGSSLSKNVKVFVGMGGANAGLTDCYTSVLVPTCGETNGQDYNNYLIPRLFPRIASTDPEIQIFS
jgi:hypothetical protein